MMEGFSKFGKTRRRRAAVVRLLIFGFAIWLCYNTAVTWWQPVKPLENAATDTTSDRCSSGREADPSCTKESTLPSPPPSRFHTHLDIVQPQDSPQIPLRVASRSVQEAIVIEHKEEELKPQDNFKDNLRRLLSSIPDEIHVRDLLRPVEGTGEEKVREVGLRTRSYKTFLEIWEAVHLVPRGKDMYIRDDVVQYVRSHPELEDEFQSTQAQIIRTYELYRGFMVRMSSLLFPWTSPYFPDHVTLHAGFYGGGRGLVFSAGDTHAPFLLTSIPALRKLGCNLPIEVMYLGDYDLSEEFRIELESIPGVVTRDLSMMVNDKGWSLAGWAGKPFAILFSSFREAIFIDADSLFFQNPEVLFDDPSYVETGALFFRDRLMMPESKKRWLQRILPKPISKKATQSRFWTGESGHMQESGVVVVDKWKHFAALLLVTRMNGPDRDGNESQGIVGVYDMVYGDKETFWLGWELAGDSGYAFHRGDAGIMGTFMVDPRQKRPTETTTSPTTTKAATSDNSSDNESTRDVDTRTTDSRKKHLFFTICAPQLLHLDVNSRPLWFNGWLLPNKFTEDKNQEPSNFTNYLQEPHDIREPGAWQLRENNICCLTSQRMFEFTQEEKAVLEMILETGRRVGAIGKKEYN